MPDENLDKIEADANASASQQPPQQSLPPVVESNKENKGDSSANESKNIQKTKVKPEHWANSVQAVCTVLIVIITAYYTRAAYRQTATSETAALAAKSAADTAANELELSHRPWVSAKFAPRDNVWTDEEGLHLTVEMDAKNIGQSPAVRVEYEFAIISFPTNPFAKKQELCNTVELRSGVKENKINLQT